MLLERRHGRQKGWAYRKELLCLFLVELIEDNLPQHLDILIRGHGCGVKAMVLLRKLVRQLRRVERSQKGGRPRTGPE